MLSREEIEKALSDWYRAWEEYELEQVLDFFHDDIAFEHWTGREIRGKTALRRAWRRWFADPRGFRFVEEDTFIDASQQKVLYRWHLEWVPLHRGSDGVVEKRRGVDILHLREGKVIKKLTYSKTIVENEVQATGFSGQRHTRGTKPSAGESAQ